MFKTCVIFAILACALGDEPFSIGLGTLSPSYQQTVGKDDKDVRKVNFEHKADGFSYTIGDPASGSTSYYSLGSAANANAAAPAIAGELKAPEYKGTHAEVGHQPAVAHQGLYHGAAPHGYAGAPQGYSGAPQGYAGAPQGHNSAVGVPYQQSAHSFAAPAPAYQHTPVAPVHQPVYAAPAYQHVPVAPVHQPVHAAPAVYQSAPAAFSAPSAVPVIPAGFSYHGTEGQVFKAFQPNFVDVKGVQQAGFAQYAAPYPQAAGHGQQQHYGQFPAAAGGHGNAGPAAFSASGAPQSYIFSSVFPAQIIQHHVVPAATAKHDGAAN